jgi:hypothetical protein
MPGPLPAEQQPTQTTPAAPEHPPKPEPTPKSPHTPAKPTTPPMSQQGLQHSHQGKGQDQSNSHADGAGQSDAQQGQAGTTGPHGNAHP